MTLTPINTGWIEVICGPMFSGKTEELIRRLVRAQIAKQRVAIFKPPTDNRFSEDYIVSHNKRGGLNPPKTPGPALYARTKLGERIEVKSISSTLKG